MYQFRLILSQFILSHCLYILISLIYISLLYRLKNADVEYFVNIICYLSYDHNTIKKIFRSPVNLQISI